MTINFSDVGKTIIYAGLLDENNVASVSIDCSAVLNQYPGSSATMLVQLPSGNEAFPVYCVFENGVITHTFTEAELQTPGMGKLAVMVSTQDGAILKRSHTAFLMIGDALTPGGTVPPSIMEEWIIWAGEALTEARNSRDAAAASRNAAETASQNAQTSAASASNSAISADADKTLAQSAASSAAASAGAAASSATAAETAQNAAQSAQTAAETAQSAAETARSEAESAAENAGDSADAAAGSASDAQSAKTGAQTAQSAAETAALNAGNSADAAQSAQTAAESAKAGAEAAAESASSKTSVSVDGAVQTSLAFTSDPQAQLDALDSEVRHDGKILRNVTELLKGHEYSPETGASPAYAQTVPTGAAGWAGVGMIGGHSEEVNGTVVDGRCDKIVTADADAVRIAEYPIPAEIQALEGYGWSARNKFNYIDFENRAYHREVTRVDMGGLSWTRKYSSDIYYFEADVTGAKGAAASGAVANAYNRIYSVVTTRAYVSTTLTADKTCYFSYGTSAHDKFRIRDDAYTDADAFGASLDGVYLYYELNTADVTDVSAYIPEYTDIAVESGGTVVFHQQDGAELPLPNTVGYWVRNIEALEDNT